MKINVGHPQTIDLSSNNYIKLLQNISFPILLKPNTLSGSRGITIINNQKELFENLKSFNKEEIKNYHIQQYLSSTKDQIKVQLLVDKKTNLIASSVMIKKGIIL